MATYFRICANRDVEATCFHVVKYDTYHDALQGIGGTRLPMPYATQEDATDAAEAMGLAWLTSVLVPMPAGPRGPPRLEDAISPVVSKTVRPTLLPGDRYYQPCLACLPGMRLFPLKAWTSPGAEPGVTQFNFSIPYVPWDCKRPFEDHVCISE